MKIQTLLVFFTNRVKFVARTLKTTLKKRQRVIHNCSVKRTCSYTNPFRRTTINVSLWTDTRVCKHASITELTPSEPSCQDRSHTLQVDASRAHSFLKRRLASKFPRRNADERENKTTRARRSREDEPKESHGRFPEKKRLWWHLGRHLAGDTLRMRT